MSLVVELEEGGGVGVVVLQVEIVDFGFRCRVPAVFADVHLRPPLLVVVLVRHPVHFEAVAFQGTTLGERFLTEIALVGSNSCMSSCVSFQVEGVVEALSTEGTKIAFHITVALHVSVEKSLQAETFLADFALELAVLLWSHRLGLLGLRTSR